MKFSPVEGNLALIAWGAALMAGGLFLSFFPTDVTTGFACIINDEVDCFPTSAMVPSPYHALGIISVGAAVVLIAYAVLRSARS